MNDKINQMFAKIEKLERQIKLLGEGADQFNKDLYITKTKDLLNFSCVKEEKINLAVVDGRKNQKLLFDCSVELYSSSNQNIEISLKIENIVVSKINSEVLMGKNKIVITQKYEPIYDSLINVNLVVKPLLNKQVILEKCELNIWGAELKERNIKYDIIELNENYLLSYLKDNVLYYKIITKNVVNLNEIDFDFCAKVLDYKFLLKKDTNELFLCRVDLDNNLIIDNFETKKLLFLQNNVTSVSATNNYNKIVVCFIKNKKPYILEIKDDIISIPKEINNNLIVNKCDLIKNEFNGNCYLILNLVNGENIMFESISEKASFGENIKTNYSIDISLYEVQNEN